MKQILSSPQETSIGGRLRAVMLFTSAVVLIATSVAFIAYEVLNFRAQLVQHLTTLAAVIADNSAVPLAFHNKDTAEDILFALKAEPTITAAVLYDDEGRFFASYPPGLDTRNLPALVRGKQHRFTSSELHLFRPVYQEGKVIGTFYLRTSLAELYRRVLRYAGIALAILLASFAGAALLSALLQNRISAPVLALTNTARAVAEREDYSLRAPRLSTDEVGLLADAFNRMLAQTQEHQARLAEQARLLDLSFDAILVLSLERKIIYWNRGAAEIYGFSAEQAVGKNPDQLLQTEFPEPLERLIEKLHRDGRWLGELVQTRQDGRKIVVGTRWALDRDAQGHPAALLETNNDVTERKRAEDALAQAQAELRRHAENLEATVTERTARLRETIGELEAFSYSISHDMRAPLRAMTAYAHALIEDEGPQLGPEGKERLDQIVSAATRMDQLITDVLNYSRVARAHRKLERVEVEQLIREIIAQFPQLKSPAAEIHIKGPLPPVLGDRASLGQCISNLLTNAVKFVDPAVKPIVHIRAEPVAPLEASESRGLAGGTSPGETPHPASMAARPQLRIWFEDNGIGIAPQDLHRIFGMFERVHPREMFEGTGIGLAIVQKAVERMGGRVGVESTPGSGSRFWLQLAKA